MTSQQILQSDFIDILFDGRNKAYGAYELRRSYASSLLKAIGITILLVTALLLFAPSSGENVNGITTADDKIVILADIPEAKVEQPKPVVPQQAAAATPVKTEVLTEQYEIKEESHNPPASQDDLMNAMPGGTRIDGPPAGAPPTPPATPGVIGGVDKPEEVVAPPPALPNRQPQFPGGQAAWLRFLERFLQSPEELEEGERRTVSVKFVVDEEGAITAFQVVQSGGPAFDNEVIRVLKKMPKWLPAIQNGKPATATFTQPVTFAVQ